MNDELPPVWFVEEAIRRTWRDWPEEDVKCEAALALANPTSGYKSEIAHARTIAKHEPAPVDADELKRRQDAREFAARFDGIDGPWAPKALAGETDGDCCIQSVYLYACHRDKTTPIPVEEWGK